MNLENVFEIEYHRDSFFAIRPESGTPEGPSEVPEYPDATMLFSRCIEDVREISEEMHLPGTITITLDNIDVPGITLGEHFEVLFADSKHGGCQIPRANFTIRIELEKYNKNARTGLRWNAGLVRNFDWKHHIKENLKQGFALAKRILDDADYAPTHTEKKQYEKWERTITLLETLKGEGFTRNNLGALQSEVEKLIPRFAEFREADDKDGGSRRSILASSLDEAPKKMEGFRDKKVERGFLDAQELAKYVFRVFRYYMNKVIRYFKYERMHHWLKEIRESESGYFFIKNRVTWNGQEIVPYGVHSVIMSMLKMDEVYMDETDWWNSVEIVDDPDALDRYAEGFELGGIFSQTYEALAESKLEQAVILAITAIEAELNFILEDQRRKPKCIDNPFSPKDKMGRETTAVGYMMGSGRNYFTEDVLQVEERFLDRWWKDADDARSLRNRVIHDKMPISKNKKNRRMILRQLDSVRLLTYALDRWREEVFH